MGIYSLAVYLAVLALSFGGLRRLKKNIDSSPTSLEANRWRYTRLSFCLIVGFFLLVGTPKSPQWLVNIGLAIACMAVVFWLWGWLRPCPMEYHRALGRLISSFIVLLLFYGFAAALAVGGIFEARAQAVGGWTTFLIFGLMVLAFFPFYRALELLINGIFHGLSGDILSNLDALVKKATSARDRLDIENLVSSFVLRTTGVLWCGIYREVEDGFVLSTFQSRYGRTPPPLTTVGPEVEDAASADGILLVQNMQSNHPLQPWMVENKVEGIISSRGLLRPMALIIFGPRENHWTFAKEEADFLKTMSGIGAVLMAKIQSSEDNLSPAER